MLPTTLYRNLKIPLNISHIPSIIQVPAPSGKASFCGGFFFDTKNMFDQAKEIVIELVHVIHPGKLNYGTQKMEVWKLKKWRFGKMMFLFKQVIFR